MHTVHAVCAPHSLSNLILLFADVFLCSYNTYGCLNSSSSTFQAISLVCTIFW